MTESVVDLYAKVISEQLRKERGELISESKEAAEKVVHKMDSDAFHVGSHGTQHAFAASETDRGEANHYFVHDTATGKTHSVTLDHGGEMMSHAQVKKAAGPHIHPQIVKALHKDHKDEMDMG